MDPTRNLCQVKDSFLNLDLNLDLDLDLDGSKQIIKEIPKFVETSIGSPRAIRNKLFTNKKEFHKLINIKNFSIKLSDPYNQISDNYFKNRSSLILANIDLVFNFSEQDRGYLIFQYLNKLDYAVLDGEPGFLKYLQFRLPIARAFTNCSVIDKKIEKTYLNINCENEISKYILSIVPEGVNLVFSNSLNYKENLLNTLKIIKTDGTFISRIDTNTDLELLYITSLCFKSFTIFKPFLENLNEKYSYIIGEKYKGNCLDIINKIENLVRITISNSFLEYIQNYYDSLNELKENLNLTKPEYNMYRCKAILNII